MQIDPQIITSETNIPIADQRLKEFAYQLAKTHTAVMTTRQLILEKSQLPKTNLLENLKSWELDLRNANKVFKSVPAKDLSISRAGEWMLDNFYVVKQTLRQIREDLPFSFLDQLPKLSEPPLQGHSRIFALAHEWIGYNQSQLDLTQTAAFVWHYQEVTPLTIGELWALPIMLRIGLLEQLVRATTELTGLEKPKSLNETPNQFVFQELAANESIVASCFVSLRLLATTDWKDIFEQISQVEQVLRDEPAQIYAHMDFETRNNYRGVIEELARHSSFSEVQIAQTAVELTRSAADNAPTHYRQAHVGYYLMDAGRPLLEKSVGYQSEFRTRAQRALLASPTLMYLGSIGIVSMFFTAGLLAYAILSGGSTAQLIIVGLLGFGLALEAAITLVHWDITHRIRPQRLPRMDFSKGIPAGYRTMVVVPTLLESADEFKHLLQELELYYLSNRDSLLTYALLTDFGDAPAENMPGDEELLRLAGRGIEDLNKKYSQRKPFYLFHRQRQWNQSEGVWMGWERKRGKLADFNRLLLNLSGTAYTTQIGEISILQDVKYVITLDADTSLPQGSANRLVATLAHPLNHAEFSADGRSVVAGYTVLQPRVAIKPTSANRSLFSQIFAGSAGFDLYSFAVSDVYQDMFGEGSYVGKGIYDVAAFERSLAGQVRQNTLLSHDLFEGIYGRAALVTDITLYEEYPWRYMAYARRLRRWIRGDWQLLPWLFPIVQTQNGPSRNRLSLINLWKIFDNLRRSLLPPTMLMFLVTGWLFLPGSPLVWTLLVLLPSTLPIIAQTILHAKHHFKQMTLAQILKPSELPLTRWALSIIFLPFEALLMLGAIRTTLVRLLVARKNLLQWTTAANAARLFGSDIHYETLREMRGSIIFTIVLLIVITIFNPTALWAALPLLIAWLFAPETATRISLPITHATTPLSEPQRRQVLRLARRTWAFFEQFTGPNDHWLPPDHFQESPRGNVAHYTTPTNIGMFLVSTLSAYDLGYIGLFELAVRLRSTFETMDRLEHYRGHLLNWYDSQTLAPLPPRYVSTVDSGNLAACLITLKQGCLALANASLFDQRRWQGVLVILDILGEALQVLEKNNPHASIESFEVELTSIYERIHTVQNQPEAWVSTLVWLSREGWERVSHRLIELLESHPNLQPESLSELQLYLDLMRHQVRDMQRALDQYAPWSGRLDAIPESFIHTPGWQDFRESLPVELPTLGQAVGVYKRIRTSLNQFKSQVQDEAAREWCQKLEDDLLTAQMSVTPLLIGFQGLADEANTMVNNMDFRFLFNEHRQVFHIGYNVGTEQLDPSFYDLLASEARIASLVAIAKGDVPQSHWQHLGRPVTQVKGEQVLLSWSGTMFEYLMPTLFTKNYPGTFLSDSCYTALDAQVHYGREKKVPWGVSESGYYAFDVNLNYQYQAFGVPNLGYKRESHDDLVITPYASLIGLSLRPQTILKNMAHLEELNMLGRFGFYESLDYTKTRIPEGQPYAIVKSYMAHHQGMILVAAANYLLDDVTVKHFHADAHIQSVELLLQEKIPPNPHIEYPHPEEPVEVPDGITRPVISEPWRVPVESPIPQLHVLSQGDTRVVITNAGGGYSQWREFSLTRWHADTTLDQWGTCIYVQDRESGALWSATSQSGAAELDSQEVMFYPYKAEFKRSAHGISLRTDIIISTDGVEIRRVNILNDSDEARKLKLVSYGEVVLAAQSVDRRHPAFNKLFIESEYLPGENALLFQRRPRSADEKPLVLVHAMLIEAGRKVTGEYETDRAKFIGRSNTLHTPQALQDPNSSLSCTAGGTLDPIFSLAQNLDLKPHAKTRVTYLTVAASTRAEALEKLSRYQTGQSIYHAFHDARTYSERAILEHGLNSYAIENIQRLLSALTYSNGILRSAPHILAQNRKGQSGLWAFGISGDFPILMVRVQDGESHLLHEALQAFNYWHSHDTIVNLLILNDQDTGYALDLHNAIQRKIRDMSAEAFLNQRDGIFVMRSDQLQLSDKILFETVAGVILDEKGGTLADHALRLTAMPTRLPQFIATLPSTHDPESTPALTVPTDLLMDNGLGGFSPDGREYVIHLEPGQHTPHPWINVIANPQFGFLVSESGSACTWAGNSGENRLTPWRNDPVTDMPGEAVYLRDEETGLVWSPTPMPAGAETVHVIHHGAGYSIFESQSHGLNQNLRMFTDPEAPLKIVQMRLQNLWERPRRITVTYYAEWVLGTTRDTHQAHVMPEFYRRHHALLASNHFNSDFGARVAFLAASKKPHGLTTDRTEFLGRMGNLRAPAALGRIGLASSVHAGLDPCAAIQLHVDLAPGATEEVFFLIGEGKDRAESLALIGQIQAKAEVESIWLAVQKKWDDVLNTIKIETPDAGMDLMLNRWLLYQTLSCRLWGRTALYQSSGAFGFRDQLQDVMGLFHTRPEIARAQILEAARHQFEEGDVLHWWNPPADRGVRTRFSDDLFWLPFVTAEYVAATGDQSILNESIPFLKGELLRPDEMERYTQFETGLEGFSLYEHCRRALEKGNTSGAHGLPLMGGGDWNDGMNRVGMNGQGESVWLGWFLHAALQRFAQLGALMKDDTPYLQQAQRLAEALETNAWDGEWYLRAYYDDGSRLGSHVNNECQIDSIAQSWAVLSGAGDPARAAQAMESVNKHLVKPVDQLILLFTPPFDKSARDPGYIKGYLPGIRENGGQYTHAAIWTAWAFAKLGQGDRATQLFRLLNPISHADTPEKVTRYKVEPYVIAADVYGVPPHTGRGGWTWYTGSSGWMYRLGIEAILGITRQGSSLHIDPCIPHQWPGFKVEYRFGGSLYKINVENPGGVNRGIREISLNGNTLSEGVVSLTDDGQIHEIRVLME
jgi:cyclic beta-1,2-glucan synthetase